MKLFLKCDYVKKDLSFKILQQLTLGGRGGGTARLEVDLSKRKPRFRWSHTTNTDDTIEYALKCWQAEALRHTEPDGNLRPPA